MIPAARAAKTTERFAAVLLALLPVRSWATVLLARNAHPEVLPVATTVSTAFPGVLPFGKERIVCQAGPRAAGAVLLVVAAWAPDARPAVTSPLTPATATNCASW